MMNCELLATCSALGYLEGDVYHREPDCLGRWDAGGRRGWGGGGGSRPRGLTAPAPPTRRERQGPDPVPAP